MWSHCLQMLHPADTDMKSQSLHVEVCSTRSKLGLDWISYAHDGLSFYCSFCLLWQRFAFYNDDSVQVRLAAMAWMVALQAMLDLVQESRSTGLKILSHNHCIVLILQASRASAESYNDFSSFLTFEHVEVTWRVWSNDFKIWQIDHRLLHSMITAGRYLTWQYGWFQGDFGISNAVDGFLPGAFMVSSFRLA